MTIGASSGDPNILHYIEGGGGEVVGSTATYSATTTAGPPQGISQPLAVIFFCFLIVYLESWSFNSFLLTAHQGLVFYLYLYLYNTVCTALCAAPQTTLWGGPGTRFEPGTGGIVAGTLTNRPPHLPRLFLRGYCLPYHLVLFKLPVSFLPCVHY